MTYEAFTYELFKTRARNEPNPTILIYICASYEVLIFLIDEPET